jgi:hypothetical protein
MTSIQSKRLAQFWNVRVSRLMLNTELDVTNSVDAAQFIEAIGWLAEGVFCGAFDAGEADVVWTRLRPIAVQVNFPGGMMVSPLLLSTVRRLIASNDPFTHSQQMTEGRQKNFELPLFSHALLLSDRFASDSLASLCTYALYSFSETQWTNVKEVSESHDYATEVLEQLSGTGKDINTSTSGLLAGCLCLLKHMESSRNFFAYAKEKATGDVDFGSFRQRIGALNAWRVPLITFRARARFEDLRFLMEYALRPTLAKELVGVPWSLFQDTFRNYFRSIEESWEAEHYSPFLVLA